MSMVTARKVWTLEELHSLPDDGNKYELIHGELFVTPSPTDEHETILARLTRLLDPFVASNSLGYVYRARAVMRFRGSEAEPDLMVRQPKSGSGADWDTAPTPILVVEVLSGSTRRRDHEQKRNLYIEAGVEEYWIVDPERRSVTVVQADTQDRVERERLTWAPSGVGARFEIQIAQIFG